MPQNVETSLYVDDFAVFTRSASLPAAERRIQLAINKAYDWSNKHGFVFSPRKKTSCMHFTKLRGAFPEPTLYLGQNPIRNKQEIKFLGMILDPKLTWIPHLKDLKRRTLRALDLFKCISKLKWGADRSTLIILYRSSVRSKIDYGCQIYASAAATSLKMLDTIHHTALRLCSGAFRTSPVLSLYAECGEPSLSLRRQKLSLQFYTRIQAVPNTPTSDIVNDRQYDHYYDNNQRLHTTFGYRCRKLTDSMDIPNINVMPINEYHIPPYKLNIENLCPEIMDVIKSTIPPLALKIMFDRSCQRPPPRCCTFH